MGGTESIFGGSTTVVLLHGRYLQRARFASWQNLAIPPQQVCALMGVVSEGVQGVLVANERGARKSVHGGDYDRVMELTTIF